MKITCTKCGKRIPPGCHCILGSPGPASPGVLRYLQVEEIRRRLADPDLHPDEHRRLIELRDDLIAQSE